MSKTCDFCHHEIEGEGIQVEERVFCSQECLETPYMDEETAFREALQRYQEKMRALRDPMESGSINHGAETAVFKCPNCGELYEPRFKDKEEAPE